MTNRKEPKWGTVTKEGLVVGTGKNRRVVPPDEVLDLARLHCTYKEMSEFFGINVETLKYNFSDIIAKGRSETKQALRKAQIKLALSGNATMLIWLGKNILDQAESPLQSQDTQVLPWDDTDK
jgi:DNA-binding CsgD family transcriptional regulator